MVARNDGGRDARPLHQLRAALLVSGLGAAHGELGQGQGDLLLHVAFVSLGLVCGGQEVGVGGASLTHLLQVGVTRHLRRQV